jgi:tRNA-splicing ligase RtcB
MSGYEIIEGSRVPILAWTKGVVFEPGAKIQLIQTGMLPIIYRHIAVMPDVHFGRGSTVGSVIPTLRAIIPGAVGVDLGCGMIAVRTSLMASQLPDNADKLLFDHISAAVPHGSAKKNNVGNWSKIPGYVNNAWSKLAPRFNEIIRRHGRSDIAPCEAQLGTLGGGNHFISICLDEIQNIWIVLHSGSRGIGNKIGTYFTELAKKNAEKMCYSLPNKDLAYFEEGSEYFNNYIDAMLWAQKYAQVNRELILRTTLDAINKSNLPRFTLTEETNIHHNYAQKEIHFEQEVWITRKGATSAKLDEIGIIPGCMAGTIYITKGKGNPDSFCSCSHGAGRIMSRGDAKRSITLEQHRIATKNTACRQDRDVIDESPAAYKDINAVMAAQADLVDIVHTLHEIVNIKG